VADAYGTKAGTSMASPHVAGVVSLMLAVNPSLTNAQVLQILQSTATPFPTHSNCNTSTCGAGIVNAGRAVDEAARRVRTLAFTSDVTVVNEASGTVSIPVKLSVASAEPRNFAFTVSGTATAGADHSLTAGNVTFPAGTTEATISFTVVNDGVTEPSETVVITLSAPGGATPAATLIQPGSHTVIILDGAAAPPSLNISAASADEAAASVSLAFTVERTGAALASGVSYTVNAERVSGVRAALQAGTVELSAAENSKVVTLSIPRTELGVAAALEVVLSQPTGGASVGANGTRRVALTAPERINLPLLRR
jgi:subtilisin family serine protease